MGGEQNSHTLTVDAKQSCTDFIAISSLDSILLSVFNVIVIQQWWLQVGLLLGI